MEDLSMYDVAKACAAQDRYCEENHVPHFAPYSGQCFRCGRNIYYPIKTRTGYYTGVTIDYAAKNLVSGCPHCNASFVE